MGKQKPKTIIISFFDNSDIVNIIMIGTNAYCLAYKLEKAHVFAISIKNLKFQVAKETRLETDLKNILPEEYHNFFNVF